MILRLATAFAALATAASAQGMTCVPTRADAERLSRLDVAWREARAEAIRGGAAEELRRLGVVAEPRLTLPAGVSGPVKIALTGLNAPVSTVISRQKTASCLFCRLS